MNNLPIKAVGLISGGLDSTLAAKLMKDMGFDVWGVYFSMPWGCCDKQNAFDAAADIGVKLITLQLDERYLEIIRSPKHGYGTALNPCVDCRIHMFKRAGEYMRHIGAEFVFTGEVLGQRNMSQLKKSLPLVEKGAGLSGRLLRPLSAQRLDPTEVELNGIVDRTQLLDMLGRSRSPQLKMAKEKNITKFSAPAGGCLLTDKNFAVRMIDTLDYGYRNFRETIALKWGRHFRINANFKAILGRDEDENDNLLTYAHQNDTILMFEHERGPTLVLKGEKPTDRILEICSGLIQLYSRYKNEEPQIIKYWPNKNKNDIKTLVAKKSDESQANEMAII